MDRFQLMLAPLEKITDIHLRQKAHQAGADLTFTSMVRISALARNNKATLSRLEILPDTPTVVQLLGQNETRLKMFLDSYRPGEGFRGFNLNLGCSSPRVIQDGLGSAMVKRISKTRRLVNIIRGYGYPVSIKMRLGLNHEERKMEVYLNLIKNVDADYFVVHPRVASQHLSDPLFEGVYEECVRTGKKIVANGDIRTVEQIRELVKMGVWGAMIGRAAVEDLSIFQRLSAAIM